MPLTDSDISWQVLRQIIQDWAGANAQIAEVRPLEGGCINTTLGITTDQGDRAVLKIAPHRVNHEFEREHAQLELMRGCDIPVPKVFAHKTASLEAPHSYILMEFVEGVDLAEAKNQCSPEQFDGLQSHLADIVSRLHDQVGSAYQRVAHHEARQFGRWPDFFRFVYDPIWHECEKAPHMPVKARKQISKIHENLDKHLANDDPPRLVHWDIWSTNLLARPDEKGRWHIAALLDPNCKYAQQYSGVCRELPTVHSPLL
jgi:fructosamine-3-kinase